MCINHLLLSTRSPASSGVQLAPFVVQSLASSGVQQAPFVVPSSSSSGGQRPPASVDIATTTIRSLPSKGPCTYSYATVCLLAMEYYFHKSHIVRITRAHITFVILILL